jgi:hypothetical protein
MDKAFGMIKDLVNDLTAILVGVVGLGVVAGIVFGDTFFFGEVLTNLLGVIETLGDAGLVGLLGVAILIMLLK